MEYEYVYDDGNMHACMPWFLESNLLLTGFLENRENDVILGI